MFKLLISFCLIGDLGQQKATHLWSDSRNVQELCIRGNGEWKNVCTKTGCKCATSFYLGHKAVRGEDDRGAKYPAGFSTMIGVAIHAEQAYLLNEAAEDANSHDSNRDVCHVCQVGGNLKCCSRCPRAFHFKCLTPAGKRDHKRAASSNAEWDCPVCSAEA